MTTLKVIIQDYLWNDGYEAVNGESRIDLDAHAVAELRESLTQLATTAGPLGLCKPLTTMLWACHCYEAEAERKAPRAVCRYCSGRGCTICKNAASDAELRPSKYDEMS